MSCPKGFFRGGTTPPCPKISPVGAIQELPQKCRDRACPCPKRDLYPGFGSGTHTMDIFKASFRGEREEKGYNTFNAERWK